MRAWERPSVQLAGVFLLLGLLALWTFQVVSVPPSLRNLFAEDEAVAAAAIPPSEEQQFQNVLGRLPPPPQDHAPQVAELISRLRELEAIPPSVVMAVQRDRETPPNLNPVAWSETELEALKNYQARVREAWEPFLSGPSPDWEKFPDSALFFRSRFPPLAEPYQNLVRYGFYEPGAPGSWGIALENQPEFYLRLFRQCQTLGTLRFGTVSGWTATDVVSLIGLGEETIQKSGYFFLSETQTPEVLLRGAPSPPTIATLRAGLQTDRAVFSRSAEYLRSLPAGTPAPAALTRLLENKSDVDWFLRKVNSPKTAGELASILFEGAEQIRSLEQKTYLSGPAWRQWLGGDPAAGLPPALSGALDGLREFERKNLSYQVALAFLNASAAYRQSGVEALQNIPDPAQPGSFLRVVSSSNRISLSSMFQEKEGENYSFTFEPNPSP